jgi:hypothetical protein
MPVQVAHEQGVTYATSEAGPFALNAAVAGQTKPANVKSYQHVLRSAIAYDAAFQGEGGPEAFENSTGVVVRSMAESIRKRIECNLLGYGRSGVLLSAVVGSTLKITIADAHWAPGMWIGAEGALLDVFSSAAETSTKRTYAGAGTSFTITAVDFVNKTLTLDNVTNITGTDYIYFYGEKTATAYKTMVGLDQICTTSGTLFNIDNSAYQIFAGQTYDCGSTDLSVDTLQRAYAKGAPKGLRGSALCWVSPITYANMVADVAALTRVDGRTSGQYQLGSDNITVWCPTGKLTIEGHEMVKEGEGFIFQASMLLRSGATDVTFNRAKMRGEVSAPASFFRELTDAAGYEMRCYSNQFLFTSRPGNFIKLINIVNS